MSVDYQYNADNRSHHGSIRDFSDILIHKTLFQASQKNVDALSHYTPKTKDPAIHAGSSFFSDTFLRPSSAYPVYTVRMLDRR